MESARLAVTPEGAPLTDRFTVPEALLTVTGMLTWSPRTTEPLVLPSETERLACWLHDARSTVSRSAAAPRNIRFMEFVSFM